MCDKDSSLGNVLCSLPRREPRDILQRDEYIFPDLKERLVSVFVFVCTVSIATNVYSQKIIFRNILPLN